MIDAELTYTDSSGGLLVIMPAAWAKLLEHRQLRFFSTEAAGVLIGERRGSHLVVHEISEPGYGDVRRRCFVDRRGPHHQVMVDEAFARSSGRLQYLGEWHTHPEDSPSPSPTDFGSWQRHLLSHEQMALVIVGRKEIWAAKKIAQEVIPLLKV